MESLEIEVTGDINLLLYNTAFFGNNSYNFVERYDSSYYCCIILAISTACLTLASTSIFLIFNSVCRSVLSTCHIAIFNIAVELHYKVKEKSTEKLDRSAVLQER
jgi:hypothetical protein